MSKFKPKLHVLFKALISTKAATLKPGETNTESAFVFSGQGNYKSQGSWQILLQDILFQEKEYLDRSEQTNQMSGNLGSISLHNASFSMAFHWHKQQFQYAHIQTINVPGCTGL